MINPLTLLLIMGAGLAPARERAPVEPPPEPPPEPTPEEKERHAAAVAAEDERRAAAERAWKERYEAMTARHQELLKDGHGNACAKDMAFRAEKCCCPSPFARVPEPARVEDAPNDAARQAILAAQEKRARKAANRLRVRS